MPCTMEGTPQRLTAANLVIEELPEELMIYDPNRKKAFCLNQTAALVWKQANGSRTVEEIADLMAKQTGSPVSGEMVRYSLDVLAKDGLLEQPLANQAAPLGVTRRALLQKFGIGAMALPAVTVLLVSPAKAHASSTTSTPLGPANTMESTLHHHHGGFWAWLESLF